MATREEPYQASSLSYHICTIAPEKFMRSPLLDKILTWTGRFFKIDTHYLMRGTFWSAISQIVITLSALALSMVLSRYLPKEMYGEYKYVLSLVSILSIFTLSGLGISVLQSAARGFDSALIEGFRISLRWSITVWIGALGIASYYLWHDNYRLGLGILIGGSLSPFIAATGLASSFLVAKKNFRVLAFRGSIPSTFIPAMALIVTALLTDNPLAFVAVYFVANAATYSYLFWYTLRIYHPDETRKDSGMLSYAKHLSFMGVLGGLANNLDQILLFQYVGPAQLAIYNFAIGIPDQLKGPLKQLDGMLQARFANHLPQNIRDNMRSKSLLLLAFGVACSVVYIPLAPHLFGLLFPNYMEAVPYSQLYVFHLLTLPFAPSGSYLSAKRLIREQYINTALSHALRIIFIAIGIIGWGLWGIVVAVIAARFVGGLTSYILYRIASKRDRGILFVDESGK